MSKQNIAKIDEWKKNNVVRVVTEVRKDSGLIERLEAATALHGCSRQAYIIRAVEQALDADGIQTTKESPDE